MSKDWGQFLRERVGIVSYIKQYEDLTDIGGDEWQGAHSVKHTSEGGRCLNVNEEKGLWHCFNCLAKGDVISYEMNRSNCGFKEACLNIARFAELTLPQSEMSAEEQEARHLAEIKRASVAVVLNDAARFYHSQLTPEARDYFLGRGDQRGDHRRSTVRMGR